MERSSAWGLVEGRLSALVLAVLTSVVMVAGLLGASGGEARAAAEPDERWSWPSGGPVTVTRAFDPPAQRWLAGHRGVDLAAPVGSTLFAPAEGTVVFAGVVVDRGVVSILHRNGLRTTYEPVEATVSAGDWVGAGAPIGVVQAGHSPGPLHWGARYGADDYVNPLRMLVGPSVLKAWG